MPRLSFARSRASWAALAAAAAGSALLLAPLPAASAAARVAFGPAAPVRVPVSAAGPEQAIWIPASCARPGFCAAGGMYQDAHGRSQAMLAAERRGRWKRAVRLRLPANAAPEPAAQITGVACASARDCVAVGEYTAELSGQAVPQPLIVTESRGRWGTPAVPAPPPGAATPSGSRLSAVACAGGVCEAVGSYQDGAGAEQGMAVSGLIHGGPWQAVEIHAPAAAGTNPSMSPDGVACAKPATCVAVGQYEPAAGGGQAMAAVESHGAWSQATGIAAPADMPAGGSSRLRSISCVATGVCVAVGYYAIATRPATVLRAMSVTRRRGRFKAAVGIAALPGRNMGADSTDLVSVSCAPAGPCVAVGSITGPDGLPAGVYLAHARGRWGPMSLIRVPARAAASALFGVSCVRAARCAAVGAYEDKAGRTVPLAASTG